MQNVSYRRHATVLDLQQYWWITYKQIPNKQKITPKISNCYYFGHAAVKLTFPLDRMKGSTWNFNRKGFSDLWTIPLSALDFDMDSIGWYRCSDWQQFPTAGLFKHKIAVKAITIKSSWVHRKHMVFIWRSSLHT